MKIAALIIVKKESKRLPDKNILPFRGKPMFLWNVEKCCAIFDITYVSSDCDIILRIAEKAGAIPIERPQKLCGGTPNIPVYQHAFKKMDKPDVIVAVQANSPTIARHRLELAKWLMENEHTEIMSVHKDFSIYGSIWGLSKERLLDYPDPLDPKPEATFIDHSIDIHDLEDFNKAEKQQDDEMRHEYNNTKL